MAGIRGRDDDVIVAPQSVEPDLFGRPVSAEEMAGLRTRHGLGGGPLLLFVGRLVAAKGVAVLAQAWPRVGGAASGAGAGRPTLVVRDGRCAST